MHNLGIPGNGINYPSYSANQPTIKNEIEIDTHPNPALRPCVLMLIGNCDMFTPTITAQCVIQPPV